MQLTLAAIRRTRDLLSERLMRPGIKRRDALRIMLAIDSLDEQAVRVMNGKPRHEPRSLSIWAYDVDMEQGWL